MDLPVAARPVSGKNNTGLSRFRRRLIAPHQSRQLTERMTIDLALERHDFFEGIPVIHPAPTVELGLYTSIKTHSGLRSQQTQDEPFLFLANTLRIAATSDVTPRQTVAQPVTSDTENFHMLGFKSELFVKLAVKRLLRCLARVDAALRELPCVLPDALGPKHAAGRAGKDDAYVRTKAVGVNHRKDW